MRQIILTLILFLALVLPCQSQMLQSVVTGKTTAVVGDGAIGNSDSYAEYAGLVAGYNYQSYYTTTTAGNVGYGHVYVHNDGSAITLCLALYDFSGTKLLSGSQDISGINGADVVNISMSGSYEILAATDYWVSAIASASFTGGEGISYYPSGGNGTYYDGGGHACGETPIDPDNTLINVDDHYNIFFDNQSGDP